MGCHILACVFPGFARWESADPAVCGFLGQVAPRPAEEPRLLAALLGARVCTGEGPGFVTRSAGAARGESSSISGVCPLLSLLAVSTGAR